MMRYHINGKGVPAICKAKKGNCPFGGEEQHFDSQEDAQIAVDQAHKTTHGILPGLEMYREAKSKDDLNYIKAQKEYLKNESEGVTYIERCRSSKRLHNYKPLNGDTLHYKEDRNDKAKGLFKSIGEGNLIGYYEVDHHVRSRANTNRFRKQIIEVRDNGLLVIYDKNTGNTVTTFVGHRARIETMMILADEIPSKSLLENIENSKMSAKRAGYDN